MTKSEKIVDEVAKKHGIQCNIDEAMSKRTDGNWSNDTGYWINIDDIFKNNPNLEKIDLCDI